MKDDELKLLEGAYTIEDLSERKGITKNSAYNLIAKLQKEGYATRKGGGRVKAIYFISARRKALEGNGMFEILNKYSKIKINPPFEHRVKGKYSTENAIVDLVLIRDQRITRSLLHLFNHVKDWKTLHEYSKKKNVWNETLALYELSRLFIKVRKMPKKYETLFHKYEKKIYYIDGLYSKDDKIRKLEDKFNLYLPFNKGDLE